MSNQQPPSQPEIPAELPSDFPGLNLEAWSKALPMPKPESEPKPKRTRPPTLDEFETETRAEIRQVISAALDALSVPKPEPPLVLGSDVFAPRPPRFRRKR